MNIIEKITQKDLKRTNADRQIQSFIIEHIERIPFLTLAELAEKVEVSTTSIIRFCKLRGFDGFSDFQTEVQDEVLAQMKMPDQLESNAKRYEKDDVLMSTANNDIDSIKMTLDQLPVDCISSAIHLIEKANSIYIFGMRESFSMAHYLYTRLAPVRRRVYLVSDYGSLYPEQINPIVPGDLAIFYCFPRYTKVTVDILKVLKKRGINVLLFTANSYLPLKMYAEVIIPSVVTGVVYKNTYAAPLVMTNILANAVALNDQEETRVNLDDVEVLLEGGKFLD